MWSTTRNVPSATRDYKPHRGRWKKRHVIIIKASYNKSKLAWPFYLYSPLSLYSSGTLFTPSPNSHKSPFPSRDTIHTVFRFCLVSIYIGVPTQPVWQIILIFQDIPKNQCHRGSIVEFNRRKQNDQRGLVKNLWANVAYDETWSAYKVTWIAFNL